jgi:hypothetical protein
MNEGVKTLKKLYFFDRDRETDRKKRHRDIGTERYKNKEKYKKIERQRDREI